MTMTLPNNDYPFGNDSGGHFLSSGLAAASAVVTAAPTGDQVGIQSDPSQSHFGDIHRQQQNQQDNTLQMRSSLQHQASQQLHILAAQQHPLLSSPSLALQQQQQAFAQARFATVAQTQQWQQQLAHVQFQAQLHQQQAQIQAQGGAPIAITATHPQLNTHSIPLALAGQPQKTDFQSEGKIEVASNSQLSSRSLSAPTALGMRPALNFTSNAPELGAGASLQTPSTLSASLSLTAMTSSPATTPSIKPTTKRALCGNSRSITTKRINATKLSKSPMLIASKKETLKKYYASTGGQIQSSDGCMPIGISSSAAKLIQNAMDESNTFEIPSEHGIRHSDGFTEPSTEQRKQSSRDRNREHARCTRLRKKAYVDKLKELVDGLNTERNDDARKRRVAVQRLADVQEMRKKVVKTFLEYHCGLERDYNKWKLIVETDGEKNKGENEFWMKQPVTPYRSFRRSEIQKGSRILKGVDAMIRDSASMAVMIETIGSQNVRWLQRKRDDFLALHTSKCHLNKSTVAAPNKMGLIISRSTCPRGLTQHAVSSLSSCSGSSTELGSSSEEEWKLAQRLLIPRQNTNEKEQGTPSAAKHVTSSSSSSNDTNQQPLSYKQHGASNDFHDYNAPSLPDPLPRSRDSSSSITDGIDSDNCVAGNKHLCTGSSSGEDENLSGTAAAEKQDSRKRRKVMQLSSTATSTNLPPNIARSGGISHDVKVMHNSHETTSINALLPNGHANLKRAPAIALPPFAGIGKRKLSPGEQRQSITSSTVCGGVSSQACGPLPAYYSVSSIASGINHQNGDTINHNFESLNNSRSLSATVRSNGENNRDIATCDYGIVTSSPTKPIRCGIEAHYHINEDDMILTDDVLMCPFIFRSREAVRYGALAECVQPGMLRACFSPTNKLRNIEMIFDAMGFCQQLERASGNEGMAHIIPNSLEMALAPNSEEARVITLAKPPYKIVSVNEAWTTITGYTQLDAEGKDLSILHQDCPSVNATIRDGESPHEYANAASGICTCGTYRQRDINGKELLNFMCSYPLTNITDEVTHILHICMELPTSEF